MENIKIIYKVMGRQQITQDIIGVHENSSKRKIYSSIYLIISLNKCENKKDMR